MRCFIGIKIPQEVRQKIEGIQEYFSGTKSKIKWVELENFHITLRFIGQVSEENICNVKKAVQRSSNFFSPFQTNLTEVGCFPNIRRPRVLWVGIGNFDYLSEMAISLNEELHREGFPKDKRKPHPHITIGRVKKLKKAGFFKERMQKADIPNLFWRVEQLEVFKSILTEKGPIYESIDSISLNS